MIYRVDITDASIQVGLTISHQFEAVVDTPGEAEVLGHQAASFARAFNEGFAAESQDDE